ncbi:CAF17-like 4Fe-4S cluster assembly/insertion protein YgfZ [Marinobacterium arenosum]|uniref:CAF17-like 4Fe-4S cluster assembly/insertion protein YgfZ n=1 Tax=Marinobacterium arenosum TaxID=2862496 RepID=UPI001C9533CA|nr:folate-binding protein [Marinobacterium arenosum]MBY4677045.1 folate-binding protein [Marinobacterium arenosum]
MSDWLNTLTQFGAMIDEPHRLQVKASKTQTRVVPLLHLRALSVLGPEATKFLQGQLSCDMEEVSRRGSGLGAHCNIKGHMLALYRLMAVKDGYWLRLHHELLADGLANLNKYIVFSKADAADLGDQLVGLGLIGPGAATLVERVMDRAPSEDDGALRSGNKVAVRVPGDRFELWLPVNEAVELLPNLLEGAELGSTEQWLLSEIRAGIADLRAATKEAFIPQMTNLQALGGVSFSKGCYTGQEIVTRLQHRGKLNKPMYRARVASDSVPAAGTALHSAERENVGQVVLAAPTEEAGQVELLAVINKAQADSETILLASQSGPALELLELPYLLDPSLFERKS